MPWLRALAVAAALVLAARLSLAASAYRERVITPHWTWERQPHARGTVRVLAFVSDNPMR